MEQYSSQSRDHEFSDRELYHSIALLKFNLNFVNIIISGESC